MAEKTNGFLGSAVLLLLLMLLRSASGSPPHDCPGRCRCESRVVNCTEQNDTKLPSTYPPNVLKLILDTNPLGELKAYAFNYEHLRQVTHISLKKCSLTSVDIKAFSGLPHLENIDLSMNLLKLDMSVATFSSLRQLRLLDLRSNQDETEHCSTIQQSLQEKMKGKRNCSVLCDKSSQKTTMMTSTTVKKEIDATVFTTTPSDDEQIYSTVSGRPVIELPTTRSHLFEIMIVIAILLLIIAILLGVIVVTKWCGCSSQPRTPTSLANPTIEDELAQLCIEK